MSDSVNNVCNAVINDVISWGEGGGGELFMLVARVPEGGRPLPKVCLKEANFAWAVLGGVEG